MSNSNVPVKKPGVFGKIVETVDGVLAAGASGVDALIEGAASVAGKLLSAPERLLVEKAGEAIDRDEADKMAAKVRKGDFSLEDFLAQLQQVTQLAIPQGGETGQQPSGLASATFLYFYAVRVAGSSGALSATIVGATDTSSGKAFARSPSRLSSR